MTLQEVKAKVGVEKFELNTAMDAQGAPTDWVRHWDNDNRVAVSLAKDLLALIQKDPAISTLGIQTEIRSGAQGDYTAHRIVSYKPAEFTL